MNLIKYDRNLIYHLLFNLMVIIFLLVTLLIRYKKIKRNIDFIIILFAFICDIYIHIFYYYFKENESTNWKN